MTVIEDRYRRVLRMLPSFYRTDWEEEMVATFLASMETDDPDEAEFLAEFGRPSPGEVASVAALAVRLRLGGVEAPPRSFLWGEAVRRVALVWLLTAAALMTIFTLRDLWLTEVIPWPSPPERIRPLGNPTPQDLWPRALWFCNLAVIAAYLALVFDKRRAARLLAALALVPLPVRVVSSAVEAMTGGPPMAYYPLALLVGGMPPVLALVAFHCQAPAVRRRPWLLAFGIALGVGAIVEALFMTQNLANRLLFDWPGVGCMAVVVAALLHLVGGRLRRPHPESAWPLALALLALIALAQRGVSMLDYTLVDHPPGFYEPLVATAIVEAVLLLAVLVPLVVLATRSLRQLSAVPVRAS